MALTVPFDRAKALSQELDALRLAHKIPPSTILKFNPAPAGLNHDAFKALKLAVVKVAIANGCQFIANLTLHKIAIHPDEARRFAINSTAYHLNGFPHRVGSHGMVLIDRFTDAQTTSNYETGLP